jgi:hypothetical protein
MRLIRFASVLFVLGCICPDLAAQEPPASGQNHPTLKLMGFGDFNFFTGDNAQGQHESGFREGQFVLHFVSRLGNSFSFFAEISLTARDDEFNIEVERTFIKYSFNDNFEIAGGRFHTPISWFNAAYHHGSWLQASIARPRMIAFGSEFIPIHFVGLVANGAIPSGGANLNYMAGVGNGHHDNLVRAGDAGDVNNSRAAFVRLFARPTQPYGLESGISHYVDRITPAATEEFDEAITSVYVVNDREAPQVIAEYFHVEREGRDTGQKFTSDAYYVQVAYRIPPWGGRLMPYLRYEKSDVATGEPVFNNFRSNEGGMVGLRIDVASFVAVKVELTRQQFGSDPHVEGILAQASYTF